MESATKDTEQEALEEITSGIPLNREILRRHAKYAKNKIGNFTKTPKNKIKLKNRKKRKNTKAQNKNKRSK